MRWSQEAIELIFLDVGSLDGTAEYLAGLRDGLQNRVRVEVCRAATDLDISDACKEALEKAHGEFVCLLNNDTVVTPGWLQALTGLAKVSEAFGLIGPMSNYAAPPQLVETVPYRVGAGKKGTGTSKTRSQSPFSAGTSKTRSQSPLHSRSECGTFDVAAVQAFARDFAGEHRGKWMQVERLGGFCLLVRRAVLDRIGAGLNEWTDLGLFDTDILSAKAREQGFQLVCCRDLFVHHFGTRTFAHGAPAA